MQMIQVLRTLGLLQKGEVLYADDTSVTHTWSSPKGGGVICGCCRCYAEVLSAYYLQVF